MTRVDHYGRDELQAILGEVGENVQVHRSVLFFNGKRIRAASNIRIDCFSLVSAGDEGIEIGHNVHIAAGVHIYGGGGKILLHPFVGLSSRVTVYSASDDYREGYLTGPTVPDELKKVKCAGVTFGRHTIVGAGSVIMPGVVTGTGAAVAALAFVNQSVPEFTIVAGNPAREIGTRGKLLLELEKKLPRVD
jgi:acetyltransferase-like isoleucine patch superfamily enzyme